MDEYETIRKDPDAELFYEWDWSAWLQNGALIQTGTVTITGPDNVLTVDNVAVVDGTVVRGRLKGGTVGTDYKATCRIVTNESPSQTDDRSSPVSVRQR